ncbi:EcoAI/FtnUII family type I restriction enzme subunit R [Sulfurimonas sp.]|uniref:EcoAI/FtnUII family type I restriction enzme subunit R n=1 Tax=Sulfurimonas sp. TaxID=2022749 RepID=UPI00260FA1FC|nr:type I restriction endonuclease subunit R [Sulfurimonas sp.]MCW8894597.1 DEAD/DEAH box helicase family protein [Sulfurimonas sp.]
MMNEAETRAELIDPKLLACGWGEIEDSKVLRERDVCRITDGRIQVGGGRAKPLIADYILVYKGIKLAVVEAKSSLLDVGEGVAQAKLYAQKLQLETTYSTNGKEIYSICLKTGREELVENFLTPDELWEKTYSDQNEWRDKFSSVPFESKSGSWQPRYYQELAVKNTLEAVAKNKNRILLTLATGTGKTAIAFQIAWKLFHTRWNLKRDGQRRPRILFLADRNILADQAFSSFMAFPEDALVRIKPKEIKKSKKVPTNGSIFFTIFQSFMSGTDEEGESEPYFGEYPKDYFDFIIIDECHRGGANDEGNWRAILEYFSPAVQLGLTATPKRKDNVDTYAYFGEPVFIYSLKEGINDGFLTPFKVKRIKTTLDDYIFTSDDNIIEGEIEEGKLYKEEDFNKSIEIIARENERVKIFMNEANENEKTIIFCATQEHAALVRDLVNQNKKSSRDTNYCVRVTANDGEIGEQFLREFQDNEKLIPTVLTTSQKLSTGVDARNIRNIVLMRPVNQIIEFKQIVGRGTRLYDGKEFFTIYDFVDAYQRFSDPEWDGEPVEEEACSKCNEKPCICEKVPPTPPKPPQLCQKCGQKPCVCKKKVKVKLKNGKELEIQHMMATSFWSADGKPISAEEFLQNLFGELPNFFANEEELRELWSHPLTRKTLLQKLDEAGFGKEELNTLKKLVNAEQSDLFDVLEYVFNSDVKPISRQARVNDAKQTILALLNDKQKEFIEFVLTQYIETGVEELAQEKLPILLTNKYQSLEDAKEILGDVAGISSLFIEFQKYLYMQKVA